MSGQGRSPRILYIAPGEPIAPDYSGASSRDTQNFAALARLYRVDVLRLGEEAVFVKLRAFEQQSEAAQRVFKQANSWQDVVVVPPKAAHSRVRRWWLTLLDPVAAEFSLAPEMLDALKNQIERCNPDLIWVEGTLIAAALVKIGTATPWVLSQHDIRSNLRLIRRGNDTLAKRWNLLICRRAEARVLAASPMIITGSTGDAERSKALGARRVEVIPMAYELLLPAPVEHAGAPLYIAHLGSVETTANRAGLEAYLRKVQPELSRGGAKVPLWIIGDASKLKDPLQTLLREAKADLKGFVPDLGEVLRPFNLAILPYESDSGYRTKLPVLFNYAQVVVTTRAAVQGMWVEGLEQVCVVLDRLEEFPAAITRLLASPDERERLGRAAQAFYAKHWTLDAVMEQYRRVIDGAGLGEAIVSRILIEIHEGQIVRNLLENGLLRLLTRDGNQVLLVTPGARVPGFVERFGGAGVEFRDLNLIFRAKLSRVEGYEGAAGKWLNRKGYHALRRWLWGAVGEQWAADHAQAEGALIDQWQPDVVASTHLSQIYGRGLVAAARRRGIATVGNLNSWDNAWKGLRIFPEIVTCWSENNREELVRLNGLKPEQVRVIGAPAFDAYFAADGQWSRGDLCARLGLDAARPLLLFATLGQFSQQIDETNPLEVLLRAIDAGEIPGRPQVVLRMHPWSRDSYFLPYMAHKDVVVSRYENYVPGLGWSPTREEAILAGNLLRLADVVISPGSTMSIEPALFDTPTVVPVFNEYMPEVFEDYFEQTWIKQHFRRLHENDWVPIVRSGAAMVEAINHALSDRSWYHAGREAIKREILGTLDGKATERLAEVIKAAASG